MHCGTAKCMYTYALIRRSRSRLARLYGVKRGSWRLRPQHVHHTQLHELRLITADETWAVQRCIWTRPLCGSSASIKFMNAWVVALGLSSRNQDIVGMRAREFPCHCALSWPPTIDRPLTAFCTAAGTPRFWGPMKPDGQTRLMI
jgi:hypothetical protein